MKKMIFLNVVFLFLIFGYMQADSEKEAVEKEIKLERVRMNHAINTCEAGIDLVKKGRYIDFTQSEPLVRLIMIADLCKKREEKYTQQKPLARLYKGLRQDVEKEQERLNEEIEKLDTKALV